MWSELGAVPASSSKKQQLQIGINARDLRGLVQNPMPQFSMPTSLTMQQLRQELLAHTRRAWRNCSRRPNTQSHIGHWLDRKYTSSRRSTAHAPCTHQQVHVLRETLRGLARCPQRRVVVRRTRLAPWHFLEKEMKVLCASNISIIHGRRSYVRHCGSWRDVLHNERRNFVLCGPRRGNRSPCRWCRDRVP